MSEISRFVRRYDRESKEKAVALVLGGRSQGEVSRDLGVSAWSLGEWMNKARAGDCANRRDAVPVSEYVIAT